MRSIPKSLCAIPRSGASLLQPDRFSKTRRGSVAPLTGNIDGFWCVASHFETSMERLLVVRNPHDIEDRKTAEQERERLRQLEDDLAHINRVSTWGKWPRRWRTKSSSPSPPPSPAPTAASNGWLQREPPNLLELVSGAAKIIKHGNRAAGNHRPYAFAVQEVSSTT